MKDINRRNAGILAALFAIVIVVFVYALLGKVDLVFMKGNNEVARIDDVCSLSDISISAEDIKGGEELSFTYGVDARDYDGGLGCRFEIAKTVVVNFFTFKWQEDDQVVILHAK